MSWVPLVMIIGIGLVNLVLRIMSNRGGSSTSSVRPGKGDLAALEALADRMASDRRRSGGSPAPRPVATVSEGAVVRRVVRAGPGVPPSSPVAKVQRAAPQPAPEQGMPRPGPAVVVAAAVASPRAVRPVAAPQPTALKPKDRRWLRNGMVASILLGPPKSLES
ncbi:MAG: hypothetical protein EBQ99_01475 [Planctomycetes bacterium]|nr:hypothetical protein [Planctomycetota bacterium]